MRFSRLAFCLLSSIAIVLASCDTSEDIDLLNPPLPDSTHIRAVNLLPSGSIDLGLTNFPVVAGLGQLSVSAYRSLILKEQPALIISRPARRDTIANQIIAQGTSVTYFVLGTDTSTTLVTARTSQEDFVDLTSRNVSRIIFINSIRDSTYNIKVGCLSGDTLFRSVGFGTQSTQETGLNDLSLYLFNSNDSVAVTSARLSVATGSVQYVIASMTNNRPTLYLLGTAPTPLMPLQPALVETRTKANVVLLNAIADGVGISAHVLGSSYQLAGNLQSLSISAPDSIDACIDPRGDRLVISTSATDSITTPIRLAVGGQTLVAVYDSARRAKALVLDRSTRVPPAGKILLRAVNLSAIGSALAISIGSGSPNGDAAHTRPFGALRPGNASSYITLPQGLYPFLLENDLTGATLDAGIQDLPSGSYTLFIVSNLGRVELRLLRDDAGSSSLAPLQTRGNTALLFSMVTDAPVNLRVDALSSDTLGYSYVRSTVIPPKPISISANGASTTIDGAAGNYTIGVTGTAASPQIISLLRPTDVPEVRKASIRFLNAVPSEPMLEVHESKVSDPAITTLYYGTPSPSLIHEERKYSFFVTLPGGMDTSSVVARIDGVEITAGRHYLLVIGPNRAGSTSKLKYGVLWMQE